MQKSPDAFRTISEASDEIGVASHVLRFWESKFSAIKPLKRAGGRRFYRPQDIEFIKGLKSLLQEDGLTIRGAQTFIKKSGVNKVRERAIKQQDSIETGAVQTFEAYSKSLTSIERLNQVLADLEEAKSALDDCLAKIK